MSVLIATGVLVAYLFSVGLTVAGGGDTFFEAAALLVLQKESQALMEDTEPRSGR